MVSHESVDQSMERNHLFSSASFIFKNFNSYFQDEWFPLKEWREATCWFPPIGSVGLNTASPSQSIPVHQSVLVYQFTVNVCYSGRSPCTCSVPIGSVCTRPPGQGDVPIRWSGKTQACHIAYLHVGQTVCDRSLLIACVQRATKCSHKFSTILVFLPVGIWWLAFDKGNVNGKRWYGSDGSAAVAMVTPHWSSLIHWVELHWNT